ncbi:hypothetical protein AAHS21_29450 [Mycobacterium sp. 050272]|uniref:hypothetical protein n=1 Tax=Mycobacteriaceae TaxID=1762 RepID=UPI0031974A84
MQSSVATLYALVSMLSLSSHGLLTGHPSGGRRLMAPVVTAKDRVTLVIDTGVTRVTNMASCCPGG